MLPDKLEKNFWIIGYDLRTWPSVVEDPLYSPQISLDPTIWPSARDLLNSKICEAYEVANSVDISNGLNLLIFPPPRPAPSEYIWAAFDAPQKIIRQINESFGMQHSIGKDSTLLSKTGFSFVGYDVADIWTQRTALYSNKMFQAVLNEKYEQINKWGLFPDHMSAIHACSIADNRSPDSAPFQPIGVWIKK